MSLTSPTVPVIAITADETEEEQHDGPDIADVATDIEEIDFVGERKKKRQKVHKPPPKVKRDDTTDDEEIEGFGDELELFLVKHDHPVNVEDVLELEEPPTYEETFKVEGKGPKNRRKLKNQTSTTSSKYLGLNDFEIDQGPTDVEDMEYSNDEEVSDKDEETSDVDLMAAISQDFGSTDISDSVKKFLSEGVSPMITPSPSDNEGERSIEKLEPPSKVGKLLSPISISPQLSDLTDTEILQSDDSNDESVRVKRSQRSNKSRRKRKNSRGALTDTEDIFLSDDEARKLSGQVTISKAPNFHEISKQNKSFKCVGKTRSESVPSITFTSLNEKKSRKKAQTKSSMLNVENPIEGLTDVEEMEGDSAAEEDAAAISSTIDYDLDQIMEGEFDYGIVEDKSAEKSYHKLYKTESYTVKKTEIKEDYDSKEQTDEENYDQEPLEEGGEEIKIFDNNCSIRFVPYKKPKTLRMEKIKPKIANLLTVNKEEDTLLTDTEYLNSSDEENFESNQIAAVISQNDKDDDTDTESMDDIEVEYKNFDNVPIDYLPKVVREKILVKETEDDNIITVSPLVEDDNLLTVDEGQINNYTDIEDLSGDEDFQPSIIEVEYELPSINMTEEGTVQSTDMLKSPIKERESEGETDYEEIRSENKAKTKRNTYLKDFLEAKTNTEGKLTDLEDFELSDGENLDRNNLIIRDVHDRSSSVVGARTDVEDLEMSADEQDDKRMPLTPEPYKQILQEMSGMTVSSKEGSGPFSKHDRKNINKNLKPTVHTTSISPMQTDTDEIFTSADESHSYSRAETATPYQMRQQLDEASMSNVTTQHTKKINLEAADEVMYIKGGGFISDHFTDIEEMGISDEEYYNAIEKKLDDKNQVCLCIGGENGDISISVGGEKENLSWLNGEVSSSSTGLLQSTVMYSLDCSVYDPKSPTLKLPEKSKSTKLFSMSVSKTINGYITCIIVDSIPVYKRFLTMLYLNNTKLDERMSQMVQTSFYEIGNVNKSSEIVKRQTQKDAIHNTLNESRNYRSGSVGKLITQYEINPNASKSGTKNFEDSQKEPKIVYVKTIFNIDNSKNVPKNEKNLDEPKVLDKDLLLEHIKEFRERVILSNLHQNGNVSKGPRGQTKKIVDSLSADSSPIVKRKSIGSEVLQEPQLETRRNTLSIPASPIFKRKSIGSNVIKVSSPNEDLMSNTLSPESSLIMKRKSVGSDVKRMSLISCKSETLMEKVKHFEQIFQNNVDNKVERRMKTKRGIAYTGDELVMERLTKHNFSTYF